MAWFTVSGSRTGESAVQDVAAGLRDRGLHEGRPVSAGEPGVVLVAGDPARAEDVVHAAASGGRVLVALGAGARADPWRLLECGAEDVVPLSSEDDADHLLARLERWAAVDAIVESDAVRSVALGSAHRWKAVLREVVEMARFTTSSMLLTGETGTGKEVVARLVHDLDPRPRRRELVLLDCTTIVPSLSGSEFFGHEKGAFTGASGARSGAFGMADHGTLFLDEVGELPAELQAALLRVVQEGTYKPVGGSQWQHTSFRLLAATNRDLRAESDAGRFRRDLYFRLAAVTVRLPPLRERREDVVPLFHHFLSQARPGQQPLALDPAVVDLLQRRPYPGNVRDLSQLAVRVGTRHVGDGPVSPGDISPDDRPGLSDGAGAPTQEAVAGGRDPDTWDERLEQAIRLSLRAGIGIKQLKSLVPEIATDIAMAETDGPAAAARMLGISRRALDYRTAGGAAEPDQAARPDAASNS
ncbi:Sigma 54 interacting domain protein [Modestobacter italicus]|uniref:Sigma 54 interacting domain protein n=1 Tax=Modestobacter italicus (strain DSM 44449 / CECT 9708 / BC 501) TaxID=2732864 RepID=I4EX12_MODI5|nr:sigma 54-interacting transcriptional regulator [Modestobacter marinus]CCH87925.1 Sigma 54 interacting domain protein [Modestobacter marinus]